MTEDQTWRGIEPPANDEEAREIAGHRGLMD